MSSTAIGSGMFRWTVAARTAAAIALAVLALAMPGRAFGQDQPTDMDVRRENEQLKQRLAQLEAQNTQLEAQNRALQERVTLLNSDNKLLREQLARAAAGGGTSGGGGGGASGGGTGSGGGGGSTTADREPAPADPFACTESMFNALQAEYAAAFADMKRGTDHERQRYLAEVGKWSRNVERKLRRKVEWTVRVNEFRRVDSSTAVVKLDVLNPITGASIGEPQSIEVPLRAVLPLAAATIEDRWKVTAMFAGGTGVNAQREEQGFFDTPRFVGPFVELDLVLEIQGLEKIETVVR